MVEELAGVGGGLGLDIATPATVHCDFFERVVAMGICRINTRVVSIEAQGSTL